MKNLVVVGGGSAGWMSACYFITQGFNVTLVESPTVPNIGVGESCLPALSFFCEQLGLDDKDWMPESNAVHKLGIFHYNWREPGSLWKSWFGYDRTNCNSEWFLNNSKLPARSERQYSYHVDAIAFGKMLRDKVAIPKGVTHIVRHITDVQLAENGFISHLVLDNGETVTGDFYIDCSGTTRLLGNKVGIMFKPYGDMPNDRAIACPQELEILGPPKYTITYAESNGWLWNTALTHRRGCGYTYSSAYSTDDEALQVFLRYNPNSDLDKLKVIKFDSQYAVNPLEKNVLAVGFSSGFIEPLEATGLHLIQYYIETFGKFIQKDRDPEVFNKTVQRYTKEMYEFVLSTYTLSKRTDSDYWMYFNDLERKLNTRELVLARAAQPDTGKWSGTKLFPPYSWWSKADHFGLYA